jgi:hypothetical protein
MQRERRRSIQFLNVEVDKSSGDMTVMTITQEKAIFIRRLFDPFHSIIIACPTIFIT